MKNRDTNQTENKDVRARIYELATSWDEKESIKAEIEAKTALAATQQKEAEAALEAGDYEKYKNCRRDAQDLRDYVDELAKRLINTTIKISDAEGCEIRDELHANFERLERETRAKLDKLWPEVKAIAATYNKEFDEYVQAAITWNGIVDGRYYASVGTNNTGHMLRQLEILLKPMDA